jgi:PPOX class probable F420-dependent enzyme
MPLEGAELEAFLAEPRIAHWATIGPDGSPRVRPVWFLHADGALWFTTRAETRRTGADIAGSRPVAVSIASEDRPYLAVIAYGTPEVWTDDRDAWMERIAIRYGEKEGRKWLATAVKQPDRVVLRLVPDRIVGFHHGRGDSARRDEGGSMRVELP